MNKLNGMNKSGRVACRRGWKGGGKPLFLTCSLVMLICLCAPFVNAQVQEEEVPSDDPVIEARLANLSKELRCLQCQNQTLADSPAGLAADLRREIRVQMKAGRKGSTKSTSRTEKRKDFYLIFKESVNNTAKYAEAKHASIRLFRDHSRLVMTVEDDGKGFEVNKLRSGNGLINMKERARFIGGNLSIDSQPGKGTSVRLEMPMGT